MKILRFYKHRPTAPFGMSEGEGIEWQNKVYLQVVGPESVLVFDLMKQLQSNDNGLVWAK